MFTPKQIQTLAANLSISTPYEFHAVLADSDSLVSTRLDDNSEWYAKLDQSRVSSVNYYRKPYPIRCESDYDIYNLSDYLDCNSVPARLHMTETPVNTGWLIAYNDRYALYVYPNQYAREVDRFQAQIRQIEDEISEVVCAASALYDTLNQSAFSLSNPSLADKVGRDLTASTDYAIARLRQTLHSIANQARAKAFQSARQRILDCGFASAHDPLMAYMDTLEQSPHSDPIEILMMDRDDLLDLNNSIPDPMPELPQSIPYELAHPTIPELCV